MSKSRRAGGAARRGAVAGAIAGTVTAAAMYLAALLVGVRPLPDVLAEPVLALMPGPVFGFLIDNLKHLGKVVEEAGLLLGMVGGLAALGAACAWLSARRPIPHLALAAGALAWVVLGLVVLPLAGDG